MKSNISSPKNGDEPNDKAKPVTIDLEETYSGNRALKHYPQLVFDCPFCGERKKIKAHHEITPCCSSPIIWKNNLLISKRLRTRAADAKAAQRAADRQAQLAANPALAYVIEQTGDKITVQPEEAVKINFFVGQNGLPAFKDCVDFAIKQASEKGIYDRGIIKFLINLLPGWGNGKTHVAKAEAGNAKTGRIYKLDEDGEIVFKSGEGEWDPIIWRDSEYAIGETIVVEGVTYIKTAEKVYDRQESI